MKKLIEWLLSLFRRRPPIATEKPADALFSDLGSRVAAQMKRNAQKIDKNPGEINIVYVEDFKGRTPNKFDDLRLVFTIVDGRAQLLGHWPCTTEPGKTYTENPINYKGAARIKLGQHSSWQVGMHGKGDRHEALVQTGGPVTVCRDLNKDYERIGDIEDTGYFGINQHWGYDNTDVDGASAGCLVGRTRKGHREFMAIVKSDPRYQANKAHVFRTTIMKNTN